MHLRLKFIRHFRTVTCSESRVPLLFGFTVQFSHKAETKTLAEGHAELENASE